MIVLRQTAQRPDPAGAPLRRPRAGVDCGHAVPVPTADRRRSPRDQPRHDSEQLKAAQFTGSRDERRLDALADLLAPDGPLANRISIYMVDKHYFITGKIIDLLLDEHFSARGLDMYEGGFARQLARILFKRRSACARQRRLRPVDQDHGRLRFHAQPRRQSNFRRHAVR
jgi:hypothetical protein